MGFGPRLRALASDAALYGVANVLARFLTFLLTPLYTNLLSPAEYGPIGTLYAYIGLAQVVWILGLDSAYLRFAAPDEKRDERTAFTTPALFLAGTALAASALVALLAAPIARLVGLDGHASYIAAGAWVMFLDALAALPLAHLRLLRKARAFAAVRVVSILINVAATWLFLVSWRHGAFAVLEANLLSSAATVVLVLPIFERLLRPRAFDRPLLRELVRFALPLLPSGLAAMIVQVADRPILQLLTNEATVGVYQANYRLGILMMLFVTVFQFAWQPFFLTRATDPDARPLFARVLTVYLAGAMGLFVAVTLFVDRIVALPIGAGRTLFDRKYWGGTAVVPWVLLGYVALGVYTNLTAGPTLAKKTNVFPWVTGLAALVNVGLNLVLIPRYGMVAAGWTTFVAYVVMAAGMWLAARRVYPVAYEWSRLAAVAAAGLGTWGGFVALGGAGVGLAARAALVAAYGVAAAAAVGGGRRHPPPAATG